ncbi:MAG: plasmid pRiA4b ORF-3 family protein [Cohaesibacter sp.]|nr:plasmid pRiA4b ORF-3 family protein [Cohaesibacter sp.]
MSIDNKLDAARLRITLRDLDHAPWREVDVPLSMTLKGLHDTIQATFLWFDYHLWEFEINDRRYGLPLEEDDFWYEDEKTYNAKTTRLAKLLDGEITEFSYVYDMGDYWQHSVEVIKLFEAPIGSRLPSFLTGKWRTPPEDVGGTGGFEIFLEAMTDPHHEEHKQVLEWYGKIFDPEDIDPEGINAWMKRLANRRRPKK